MFKQKYELKKDLENIAASRERRGFKHKDEAALPRTHSELTSGCSNLERKQKVQGKQSNP